jgi:hypothetical protein
MAVQCLVGITEETLIPSARVLVCVQPPVPTSGSSDVGSPSRR